MLEIVGNDRLELGHGSELALDDVAAALAECWVVDEPYDPENALAGYDLSPAERDALLSGDDKQLRELGLDQRMSKWAGDAGSFGDNGPWS